MILATYGVTMHWEQKVKMTLEEYFYMMKDVSLGTNSRELN